MEGEETANCGPIISSKTERARGIRLISDIRLVLVLASLVGVWQHPMLADEQRSVLYVLLGGYALTSLLLHFAALHAVRAVRTCFTYWLDLAWILALVAYSDGSRSVFLAFLLFPVLVASFQAGFRQGMIVLSMGVFASVFIHLLGQGLQPGLHPHHALAHIAALFALGFMIARWGGAELDMRRWLDLLRGLGMQHQPQSEGEASIHAALARIAAFFGAESCLLLVASVEGERYRLYTSDTDEHGAPQRVSELTEDMAAPLLALAPTHVAAFGRGKPGWFRSARRQYLYDRATEEFVPAPAPGMETVADLLQAEALISLPLLLHGELTGRLLLAFRNRLPRLQDIGFLNQLADQVALKSENLQLLQRLADAIALGERQKISRDLHDDVVQPYIGLKLGLEALRRKSANAGPSPADLDELIAMTDRGISQLRGFIAELRERAQKRDCRLSTVILHQARQREELGGLRVDVEYSGDVTLNDRQSDELDHIVAEGLANIARHTEADRASVRARVVDDTVEVEMSNPVNSQAEPFLPGMINERARLLGGRVEITRAANVTAVRVRFPLWRRRAVA